MDFFAFANGGWRAANPIPPSMPRWSRRWAAGEAAFGRCVGDPATAQKIRAGMSEADHLGIRGTPVFVIGARKTGETTVHALRMIEGAYPYEVFQATLDGALRARLP